MKTHRKKKLTGVALLAFSLTGAPVFAQANPGSANAAASHPDLTPSAQGPGSTVGQNRPASPVDPTGRPIDRGSGENPNRINSASTLPGADNSRPQSDALGGVAVGFGAEHSQRKLGDVVGKAVRGSDNDELGQIRDLVIDPRSGQIHYAIVNSGGLLGIGGTRRAVPFSALTRTGDDGDFQVNVDRDRWNRAPQFRENELPTLTRENRGREIYEHFQATWDDATATSETGARAGGSLLLASHLDDKDIRSGDRKVGEVEDVLINADRRVASLLIELDDDFVDTDQEFVVGFNQLTVSGTGSDVSLATELSASDFQVSDTPTGSLRGDRPYVWAQGADGQTTRTTRPTAAAQAHVNSGLQNTRESANPAAIPVTPSPAPARTSTATTNEDPVQFSASTANPQNRPATSAREATGTTASAGTYTPAGQNHVQAARNALQEDSSLRTAAQNVNINVRGESLVVSGTVMNADEKERVLEVVRRSTSGLRIDDQLRVRDAAE
jgi:sporulation protein YlmC with PRC-barrel domain